MHLGCFTFSLVSQMKRGPRDGLFGWKVFPQLLGRCLVPYRDPSRVVSWAGPAPCTAYTTYLCVLFPLQGKALGMAGQKGAQWWPRMFYASPSLQSPGWARGWTNGTAQAGVGNISSHQGWSYDQCPRAHLCRW